MAKSHSRGPRVRAWILLKIDENPEDVTFDLYRKPDAKRDEPWFMVRADVVVNVEEGPEVPGDADYNVVIPVDAQDDAALDVAWQHIKSQVNPQKWAILKVTVHNPGAPNDQERYPPQRAQGYVTFEEYRQWSDSVVPGLQIQSPGANAWG